MSDDRNEAPGAPVEGVVKWFDPGKGFGFVVSDAGGPDILLHVNVLRNYGQSSIADGSRIRMIAHQTARGRQASEVLEITPPEGADATVLTDIAGVDPSAVAQSPLLPARVKWFDKGKGFGFANIFGNDEDVFLHVEVLRRSALSDLQPGEAVTMRVIEGRRGKLAAEVHAWEAAVPAPADREDSPV